MKVIEKQHFVQVEGNVEVKKFGFIFNAKMVKLLSDNLYQDKVLAIVRELSTNAYDSQVENGNPDEPFDVHIPVWNNMYFSIRDYGVGMSPERVENIYRNYGGSDRTESNDYIGGMGLGSKTPFCYHTRTFTIDVWYGGIHTCYSAYIGEDGIPCIAKMSECASNEPSGVKIKMPVKQYDERSFEKAAEIVYSNFPVKPNITGSHVNIDSPEYVLTSDDGSWKLRTHDYEGCRVIMGNVAYPVKFDDGNMTTPQKNVMNSCFDIFADIGTFSVEIGREGLSYDNRTKTRVRHYFNKIVDDFNDRIKTEIDKCPNLWEARVKYASLSSALEVNVTDGRKILYNGEHLFLDLDNTVCLNSFIKSGELEILCFKTEWHSKVHKTKINSIHVKQSYSFFEHDLATGGFVRSEEVAKSGNTIVLLMKFNTPDAKSKVLKHIGIDDTYIKMISTIPSPTVRATSQSRGNIGRVLTFKTRMREDTYKYPYWTSEQDENLDTLSGLYVEFNRFSYRSKIRGLAHPSELSHLLNICDKAGITMPTIYGIKTADINKIKKNRGMVEFHVWLDKQIEKSASAINIEEILHYSTQLDNINSNSYRYVGGKYYNRFKDVDVVNIAGFCKTQNAFTRFADAIAHAQNMAKKAKQAEYVQALVTRLGLKIPKIPFIIPEGLDKIEKEVYNTYGLLECVAGKVLDNAMRNNVARYIDATV